MWSQSSVPDTPVHVDLCLDVLVRPRKAPVCESGLAALARVRGASTSCRVYQMLTDKQMSVLLRATSMCMLDSAH